MPIQIRVAMPDDAEQTAPLMRESIETLCVQDHRNDPSTLAQWVGNKQPEIVRSWMEKPGNRSAVAIEEGKIVGFAMLNDSGHVLLLYVLPEAAHRGIGSALLAWMEEQASGLGLSKLELESTVTALAFYERHGFSHSGKPIRGLGITYCQPMEKKLLAQ
jgi:GNAT superfamily N-acetyltransferase